MVDSIYRGIEGRMRSGQHVRHFYRHLDQLVETACRYILDGLQRGEAVVIVARQAHWAGVVGKLATTSGIDIVESVMSGQLRHIDAELALSGLLENGMPQDNRFSEHAGGMVERSLRRYGGVRIVTELAGMLWEMGNRAAAVRLEELWNGLAKLVPFNLLCTYRTDTFTAGEYNPALERIYEAHGSSDGCLQESREADASQRNAR